MLLHGAVPVAHERPDRRRRGVELLHAVLRDHLPAAVDPRVRRHALKHERRDTVQQRPVRQVRVPRDPPAVRGAPVDIPRLHVEHVLARRGRVDHVATRVVLHALRHAGGAAGVEEEEGVLGGHPEGVAGGGLRGDSVVVPHVATALHRHVLALDARRVLHVQHERRRHLHMHAAHAPR